MEVAVADAMRDLSVGESRKKNRIQVSCTKKPLFFYVNLAKRYIQQHDEVELSALGVAIIKVVNIVGILKRKGLAIEKEISLSTIQTKDESKGRYVPKAKMDILLSKTDEFDNLMAATAVKRREFGEIKA